MVDANDMQKRMEEMQRNNDVLDAYSKIVSGGKSHYKAVIEKKHIVIQCKSCYVVLEPTHKFCYECGNKVDKPVQN